jgi:Right handed beta helix region
MLNKNGIGGGVHTLRRMVVAAAALAVAILVFGGMAPSASAQTVLTACGTLTTGNYVLGNNITASGDCFVLADDNIAIDFKGHTLTGDGTGNGILAEGTNYHAISNGKIRNFEEGIEFTDDSCCHAISNMNVSNNADEGIYIDDCCSTLSDVKTNDNGDIGMELLNCCYTVTWAVALRNQGGGMLVTGCCSGVSNSIANKNGATGIEVDDCCSAVASSKSKDNAGEGIHMDGCCNQVSWSTAVRNSSHGVQVLDCCSSVTGSNVSRNGGDGIRADDCCSGVAESKANRNAGTGINLALTSDDYEIVNSTANGNSTGAQVNCGSVVLGLKATGNSSGNLVEVGSNCTNLRNKAP